MRAVILAAGSGSRLRPVVGGDPKCLARVGDSTLIERQIRLLRECGVDAITVVLGYRGADVERVCGPGVDVVYNTRFASTNSLYSLWLARHLLRDGFMVLNCDVLFHPHLLTRLLAAPHGDALLMAARDAGVEYTDEEMKVKVRRGRVVGIDKELLDEDIDGENVGIAKFSSAGAALLIDEMNDLIADGGIRDWLPRAFNAFCQRRALHVVETGRYPWIEIDFPDDYARACQEIWPAINEIEAPSAQARPVPPAAAIFGRMLHRV